MQMTPATGNHAAQKTHRAALITIRVQRFTPQGRPRLEALRALVIGFLMKTLMRLGMGILIVGGARTGKSYLLNCTFPGKVFDSRSAGIKDLLATAPDGLFAVDETSYLDVNDLRTNFDALRSRKIAYSIQRVEEAERLGLDALLHGRRTVIIMLV